MSTKPSTSDGFANPLYDKLLQYCDREAQILFPGRWYREWAAEDIEDALRSWDKDPSSYTPPYRPAPEVTFVEWQRTLKAKVQTRNDTRGFKLVDAGIVDLVVGMSFSQLDYDYKTDQLIIAKHPKPFEFLYLCRPALASVAKTLRELNAMRDRDKTHSRAKEVFGVITANLDTAATDPIAGQNYDCLVIAEDELS